MKTALHLFAIQGDFEALEAFLQEDSWDNVDSLDDYGLSPLLRAVDPIYLGVEYYKCTLLLLNAGASPLQAQEGKVRSNSPFFVALWKNNIALAGLMLWYISPSEYREVREKGFTASQIIKHFKKNPQLSFGYEFLEKMAVDAEKVWDLKIQAKTLKEAGKLDEAAVCYREIAEIFEAQEKAHKKESTFAKFLQGLPVKDSDSRIATPQQYLPLLQEYYHQQRMTYVQQAISCYKGESEEDKKEEEIIPTETTATPPTSFLNQVLSSIGWKGGASTSYTKLKIQ